jgi:hypothetical protein
MQSSISLISPIGFWIILDITEIFRFQFMHYYYYYYYHHHHHHHLFQLSCHSLYQYKLRSTKDSQSDSFIFFEKLAAPFCTQFKALT